MVFKFSLETGLSILSPPTTLYLEASSPQQSPR